MLLKQLKTLKSCLFWPRLTSGSLVTSSVPSHATEIHCHRTRLHLQNLPQAVGEPNYTGKNVHPRWQAQTLAAEWTRGALFTLWMVECVLCCCDVNGPDECKRKRAETSGGQSLRRLLHYICFKEMIAENSGRSKTGRDHACAHENISRLKPLIKTMPKCKLTIGSILFIVTRGKVPHFLKCKLTLQSKLDL